MSKRRSRSAVFISRFRGVGKLYKPPGLSVDKRQNGTNVNRPHPSVHRLRRYAHEATRIKDQIEQVERLLRVSRDRGSSKTQLQELISLRMGLNEVLRRWQKAVDRARRKGRGNRPKGPPKKRPRSL